jgi:hypothetical protein
MPLLQEAKRSADFRTVTDHYKGETGELSKRVKGEISVRQCSVMNPFLRVDK